MIETHNPQNSSISDTRKRVSIIGVVGLPANYGGFESLVENLVKYHETTQQPFELTVYCSSKAYTTRPPTYLSANLKYINLKANGISSILYDIAALIDSATKKYDTILLLGVSGAIALPIIRLLSNAKIITNVDGIEWKRQKWGKAARVFLKVSEWAAAKFSDRIIADNAEINNHIQSLYDKNCEIIAYGGDHALSSISKRVENVSLPSRYYLGICRIEPENNISMILDAFSQTPGKNIVFIGNWQNSNYGRQLKKRYSRYENIILLEPIYDLGKLRYLREQAAGYIHGHAAGGTNPSLVEMMFFDIPIFAYDCSFNRYTTENQAIFFSNTNALINKLTTTTPRQRDQVGKQLLHVAQKKYLWSQIADSYFRLL